MAKSNTLKVEDERETGPGRVPHQDVFEADSFGEAFRLLDELPDGTRIDYNWLSPAGRQAALALIRERRARWDRSGERLLLVTRTPNAFVQAISFAALG